MTNGVFEIENGKETVKLLMGFNAASEFETRYFKHITSGIAPSEGILFTDLVFSGMYCNALRNGSQIPSYGEAFDLVEAIGQNDNFNEVRVKLWNVYYESKWGIDFKNRLDKFLNDGKKKVEADQESQ
jgi:hypothetical protein